MNHGWDYGPYWLAATLILFVIYLALAAWQFSLISKSKALKKRKCLPKLFDWEQECPWLR